MFNEYRCYNRILQNRLEYSRFNRITGTYDYASNSGKYSFQANHNEFHGNFPLVSINDLLPFFLGYQNIIFVCSYTGRFPYIGIETMKGRRLYSTQDIYNIIL